jgi:threonine dehydrogenase-like Zn-dependent dehydrogenase
MPLDEAPKAYAQFQAKQDETIKVVLQPHPASPAP